MTNAKIYVGSTEVDYYNLIPSDFDHTFLFYDGDGDLSTTNDQFVIQAIPSSINPFTNSLVIKSNDFAGNDQKTDLDTDNDGYADRPASDLNLVEITSLFSDGASGWSQLQAHAAQLGNYESSIVAYDTGEDYSALFYNCNMITNTLLVGAGSNLASNKPSGTGDTVWLADIPGHNRVLDGNGADSLTLFAGGYYIFTDRADTSGKDTLTVEAGASLLITSADGSAPVSDIDIILNDISGGVTIEAALYNGIQIKVGGEQVVFIPNGRSLGAGVDINLKYDNGSSVTLLADLTSLDSSDYSNGTIATPEWLAATLTFFGITIASWWDPIVVDIDGDGLSTDYVASTTVGSQTIYPTYFDLNADGFAEAVEWHKDGFLVRDLNSNGRIDDGSEMFGDATTDGFTALAAFDANTDGVINASDAIWADLQIWEDANADGQTQSDELHTLASLDITGINLSSTATGFSGGLTHTGTVSTTSGTLDAGNYSFANEAANTRYAEDYDFDIRAAFLPTMRGYNQLADLHIAISLDNDETDSDSLISLMSDIVSYGLTDLFENYDTVTGKIEDFLFRWAGVDGVSPSSRGSYITDARQLEFVEKYLGEGFVDRNEWGTNPGAVQAREFQEFWDTDIFARLKGAILSQTVAAELFGTGGISYDPALDEVQEETGFEFSEDALDALEAVATALSTTAERQDFWLNVADFISSMPFLDIEDLTTSYSSEETKLASAIAGSDSDLVWASASHDPGNGITSIQYRYENPVGETVDGDSSANSFLSDSTYAGTAYSDVISGYGGADTLAGSAGDDVIYGHSADGIGDDSAADIIYGVQGNDEIDGGKGNDELWGGEGSDHLIGGEGDDDLYDGSDDLAATEQNLLDGGSGDDNYRITSGQYGHDTYIIDASGSDDVYFDDHFYWADATIERFLNSDLRLSGHNFNSTRHYDLILVDQFEELGSSSGLGIERLRYSDTGNPTLDDFIDIKSYITNYTGQISTLGSDADDLIYGILTASKDDFIDAKAGNDQIFGDDGDDIVWGGSGADELHGGDGDDTIYGDEQFSQDGEYNELFGDDGNDTLVGNGKLEGGNGNDTLTAQGSNNILDGGAGNDILTSAEGETHYIASSGDDIVYGAYNISYHCVVDFTESTTILDLTILRTGVDFEDLVITHAGGTITVYDQFYAPSNWYEINPYLDEITFANETNTLLSSTQIQTEGTSSGDVISGITFGGSINDLIYGRDGDDEIYGNQGNDSLNGDDGSDELYGGYGDDVLDGGAGDDTINGEQGTDTASYASASSGVTVDLSITGAQNTIGAGTDTLSNLENLSGSVYDDTLTGNANDNSISGDDGDDIISGGAGNDNIDGGSGTDTLTYASVSAAITASLVTGTATGEGTDTFTGIENITGGSGADSLTGDTSDNILTGNDGDDTLTGGDGNDTLIGGSGADSIDGGDGIDTISYLGNSVGVEVNLYAHWADDDDDGFADDTLYGVENVVGSNYDDDITGNAAENTLWGNGGDDVITGHDLADEIYGGADDDELYGQSGNDSLYGGTGLDTLRGGGGDDTLDGGADDDDIRGEDGTDTILGGAGDDYIEGGDGNDTIDGEDGADTIHGGAGDDILRGGAGNDTFYAGDDDDTMWSSTGHDDYYGQGGVDTIIFEEATSFDIWDEIFGFTAGTGGDVIDVSDILDFAGYQDGVDTLTDFVKITETGAHSYLKLDRDGTGGTYGFEQIAKIVNVTGITDEQALVDDGNLVIL